jgi:DNA-binding NtrC family response regulator/serine/threonine protein kinase/tetratricopeptide (TPR) repeat protein
MRPVLPLRFETIQVLRETATSSTFVATDHVLARNNVVVKAIRKGNFTHDLEQVIHVFACFRGLRHPHIAGILDAGLTPKGDLFYVRDFALHTELFSRKDMDLLNTLLGAIDFLHSVGHVHGSIKPTNVFASSNSVQLADPWVPQPTKQTPTEEDVRFSAPEVLKGGSRTLESDLYSVGALLYRFFSGRDLFDDADMESLISRHIWASPRPLTSISYVSRTVADIVEALIHKDPAMRKPAFESLKNELRFQPTAATRAPAFGISEPLAKAERFLQPNPERLRVLLLEAPVGFGKTRFLEELRHRMAFTQPKLVFSTCLPIGRSPYITVAQWILSLHDRHCPSFDDPSVKRLQAFVDAAQEPSRQHNADRIVQDLVDVIGLIIQKIPITLLIEDVDRAHKKTSSLLDSVVCRTTRLPMSIILTSRPADVDATAHQTLADYLGINLNRMKLEPLKLSDVQSLAPFLEVDVDRRAQCELKSGGNAMFLEEYCGHQKAGVPPLVKNTISRLVSALPKETRRVAEVLSLFEKPVVIETLGKLMGTSGASLGEHFARLRIIGLVNDATDISYEDARNSIHSGIPAPRRTQLHAFCYELLKDTEADRKVLARHAFLGGLFEIAAGLYRGLAQEAFRSMTFSLVVTYYEYVRECRARNAAVPPADVEEITCDAKCRGYLGDLSSARRALRALLETKEAKADPESLSAIYSALGSAFLGASTPERVQLIQLAVKCLAKDSPSLVYRYRTLTNVLLAAGQIDEAEMALEKALAHNAQRNPTDGFYDLRAAILVNRGEFKEAAHMLTNEKLEFANPPGLKLNLALCSEELGFLREAGKLLIAAVEDARLQGTSTIESVCLANRACVETKLGNILVAEKLFRSSIMWSEGIRRREQVFLPDICYSDWALHCIERGNYGRALHCVAQVEEPTNHGYYQDSFQFFMSRCEINLVLGRFDLATMNLQSSQKFGSRNGLFDIERLLVRCRLQDSSEDICRDLRTAFDTSRKIETRYQQCRLLLAISKGRFALGDTVDAGIAANDALEIAQEYGYRLLAAHCLLWRGLASESDAHKQKDLHRCLEEASTMDLQPLLAECSFRIGEWRFSSGDYSSARDHLYRSVAITTRLAKDLSTPDRKRFLSLPLHQEARRLREMATDRTKEFLSVLKEPLGKEDLFFEGLYRLTSSLRVARDRISAVSILIDSFKQCVPVAAVVVWQFGREGTDHSTTENTPADMKLRALEVFRKNERKTYFTSFEIEGAQASAVWVPILCSSARAGIYIECAPGTSALDDQEIQFVTVAATVTGAALDQVTERGQQTTPDNSHDSYGIVGSSEAMKDVHTEIEVAARNSATVLIEGESGTGKELVAKAIHSQSSRSTESFVAVDCGALPEGLIEAELFGAKKGAFTGAAEDRRGLFESAHNGTIFLDEIGNASPALQTKLLRILQEREVRRVGEARGRPIDVRLIAATNGNLDTLVEEGKFRQDLLFRLKVLHIRLPPLRKRKEDIPLLATAFLNQLNRVNQARKTFGAGVLADLALSDYRGNVRELQNVIERSFHASPGEVVAKVVRQKGEKSEVEVAGETEDWFRDLTEGKKTFWSAVRDSYKRRDISRERVLALVDLGLRSTQGSYKAVASMFKIKEAEYRRFMDFLRRNNCLLDFRPYRRAEIRSSDRKGVK